MCQYPTVRVPLYTRSTNRMKPTKLNVNSPTQKRVIENRVDDHAVHTQSPGKGVYTARDKRRQFRRRTNSEGALRAGQYTPRRSGKQVKASRTPPPSFPSSVDVSERESDESASDSGIDVSEIEGGAVRGSCYAGAKLHEPPKPEDLPSPPLEWLKMWDRQESKQDVSRDVKPEANPAKDDLKPSLPAGWPMSCISTPPSSACRQELVCLTQIFKQMLKVQA